MKKNIEGILDTLIGKIEKGKSLDDCLKEYPEYSDELRPLLLLAAEIENVSGPEIDSMAFKRTMAKVNSVPDKKNESPLLTLRTIILRPVFLRAASIILAFTFIISITFSFSADSLPGDFLYPVRCFCEKAQLVMAFDNKGKAKQHLEFANRKTEEFIFTFKKENKINSELLNSMLKETSNALQYCKSLSSEECYPLATKIKECSQNQFEVLHAIKTIIPDSNYNMVNEAIQKCSFHCNCADSCLSSKE
jgi:hypothetical protein